MMMLRAVVFDVDGVLLDTARLHRRAWHTLFAEVLGPTDRAFTDDDYVRLVDGRSRADGLRAVLEDRGLLAGGRFSADRLLALGERKQAVYLELLAAGGVERFPDVVPCLDELQRRGLPTAAVSASRNARVVLEAAALLDRFDAVLDGEEAARLGLAGKPAPDVFIEAAARLGHPPEECALVEDALAGVAAASAAGFGLVVGLAREAGRAEELQPRSDVVISTLALLCARLERDAAAGGPATS